MDISSYLDSQLKGNYLFRAGAITSGTPDPGDQLRIRYHSASPRNYTHYKNPEVDKAIDAQDTMLKAEERKATVIKVQRAILDDIPLVHTFWVWNYLPIQPYLHGMSVSALTTGIPIWKDVWRSKA
jgi:ABC-type transport system substrate-binding protein